MRKLKSVFLILGLILVIGTVWMFRPGQTIDVTSDWRNVTIEQTSTTSPTHFTLHFNPTGMLMIDDSFSTTALGADFNAEDAKKHFPVEPIILPGNYDQIKIIKKKDTYTLYVEGEQAFTYQFHQKGPRQFIGEDQMEFATIIYPK